VPHAPFEHTCPPGQTVPHAPQFWLSFVVLVHVPLHDDWPTGHPPSVVESGPPSVVESALPSVVASASWPAPPSPASAEPPSVLGGPPDPELQLTSAAHVSPASSRHQPMLPPALELARKSPPPLAGGTLFVNQTTPSPLARRRVALALAPPKPRIRPAA
jgi:hypothetical protein